MNLLNGTIVHRCASFKLKIIFVFKWSLLKFVWSLFVDALISREKTGFRSLLAFPGDFLWFCGFAVEKNSGRIPLFFAKRARRDGLAYHLSRIGGLIDVSFCIWKGNENCILNGKEPISWGSKHHNPGDIGFMNMLCYVCWITYTGTRERERECFFVGRIFQQFSWPQDTRGTLCLSIQFGYCRTCFDSLL